jgi:hypothetical protein
MGDNSIRFPARTTNDFNIGRAAAPAPAQAAGAAAAAAGAAAGAAAAQPIKDGLTLSNAAGAAPANFFAPAAGPVKNNAAADTIMDGLQGIKNLAESVGKAIADTAGVGAFLQAAR